MEISELTDDPTIVDEAGKLFMELITMGSSIIHTGMEEDQPIAQMMHNLKELSVAFVLATPTLVISNVFFNLLVNTLHHNPNFDEVFSRLQTIQNENTEEQMTREEFEGFIENLLQTLKRNAEMNDNDSTNSTSTDVPSFGLYL